MQCRGIWPLLVEKMSHGFSRVEAGTWGIFLSYGGEDPSKLMFVQRHQDSCLFMRDTSVISTRLGRAIRTILEVRWETKYSFPVATSILGFLSIFKKSQSSSPFEALYSTCLSKFQRDVRPPLQMRRGPRTFSRVSTGYYDIPSFCDMKEETAFKPL